MDKMCCIPSFDLENKEHFFCRETNYPKTFYDVYIYIRVILIPYYYYFHSDYSDDELRWKFTRDVKNTGWGWRFTVYPIVGKERLGSDRDILSKPSIDVVINLLNSCFSCSPSTDLITRLASALASCAQLSSLGL